MFKEINSELNFDGIQPIPPDQEVLDNILRSTDEQAVSINITQKRMTNTFKQQEYMQEKEFYYEVDTTDFKICFHYSIIYKCLFLD